MTRWTQGRGFRAHIPKRRRKPVLAAIQTCDYMLSLLQVLAEAQLCHALAQLKLKMGCRCLVHSSQDQLITYVQV